MGVTLKRNRKHYAFWRQFNEKPRMVPCRTGRKSPYRVYGLNPKYSCVACCITLTMASSNISAHVKRC